MSNSSNQRLTERAQEVCTYFEGTDLETAIKNNLEKGDLDVVWHLVLGGEAEMSQQEFYNNDILP
jgi:hypothetical protein